MHGAAAVEVIGRQCRTGMLFLWDVWCHAYVATVKGATHCSVLAIAFVLVFRRIHQPFRFTPKLSFYPETVLLICRSTRVPQTLKNHQHSIQEKMPLGIWPHSLSWILSSANRRLCANVFLAVHMYRESNVSHDGVSLELASARERQHEHELSLRVGSDNGVPKRLCCLPACARLSVFPCFHD